MKHPKIYDTTPAIRKRMSKVHLKGGKAERTLAKKLWHQGYRYRKNYKSIPGSPDIALTRQKIAIFVDGEFWHGKDWENKKNQIKHNRDYWIKKIGENIERDHRNDHLLINDGWLPIHFWEKEVLKDTQRCVDKIEYEIQLRRLKANS